MNATIRSKLGRQKMLVNILGFTAIPCFGVGGALSNEHVWAIALVIIAFAMFGVAMLILYCGMRCPRCRRTIGVSITCSGGPFSISKKYNYCPCCGVSLDAAAQKE